MDKLFAIDWTGRSYALCDYKCVPGRVRQGCIERWECANALHGETRLPQHQRELLREEIAHPMHFVGFGHNTLTFDVQQPEGYLGRVVDDVQGRLRRAQDLSRRGAQVSHTVGRAIGKHRWSVPEVTDKKGVTNEMASDVAQGPEHVIVSRQIPDYGEHHDPDIESAAGIETARIAL